MGTASPFRNGSCPFVLPTSSTPYRQPPILGRAVAIFFALQPPTTWASHACPWLKIALHLGLADCELSFFENGVARTIKLSGENVCFLGAREVHSVRWKNESPMVWIFVDEDYLRQIGFDRVSGVTCVALARLVRRDLSIFRLAGLFHDACTSHENIVPLYVEAKGTLLASRLLRAQFGVATPNANGNGGLGLGAFEKVRDYVQAKLTIPEKRYRHTPAPASREELSNAALARVAGQSEHHFIRQFKMRVKKTPQEYVMQCRLDKAEELIVAHGYSPKEAAYATGFCEPGHFYRRFRARYGQSPHDLLKQSRP